jgi:ribosomal protein S27E
MTIARDLAAWDAARADVAVTGVTPLSTGSGGDSCYSPAVDVVVPGSVRTVHWQSDTTNITVRCGRCGGEQEAWIGARTTTCRSCGRTMRLDRTATGENVTPIHQQA